MITDIAIESIRKFDKLKIEGLGRLTLVSGGNRRNKPLTGQTLQRIAPVEIISFGACVECLIAVRNAGSENQCRKRNVFITENGLYFAI